MESSNHNHLDQIPPFHLLNGVPHGIAVLDLNFCMVLMNHFLEAMIGYYSGEVRGLPHEFVLRTSLGHRNDLFKKVLTTGESVSVDGDLISRRRKKTPIHFTISPLYNYQEKPAALQMVLEDRSEKEEEKINTPFSSGVAGILGHSPQMLEIFELIPVLAQTDASVLITGETGTGKDKIAEAIHKASKRSHHPFIKINCGALPESLLESELFGHVKGAFTGAIQDKPGLFKLAHGGTLFLTEVGDLPLPLQVKLLSVLDDHDFFPVGGSKKIRVDVRIFAATHRALKTAVEMNIFRQDLYYRLNVLRLHLPALRKRDGDIRLLLDHFLQKFDTILKKGNRRFTQETLEILLSYPYAGNVREMRNIVEYASNICQGDRITPKHLPAYIFEEQSKPEALTPSPTNNNMAILPSTGTTRWSDIEKGTILEALKSTNGNRSKAAQELGWGRTTLWRKMKHHGLTE